MRSATGELWGSKLREVLLRTVLEFEQQKSGNVSHNTLQEVKKIA